MLYINHIHNPNTRKSSRHLIKINHLWYSNYKKTAALNYGLIFCPNVNNLEELFNLFFFANVPILIPVTVFHTTILSRPLTSRLVFRTQLRFVSKMTDANASVTHRCWDYSHSSFPNIQYIPNHSKYWILFFLVSLNPPNYRTFSNF